MSHSQQRINFPQSKLILYELAELRLRLDEAAETEELSANARGSHTKSDLSRLACRIYDGRRTRDRVFDRDIFGEPAWDMLLALYALPTRGELMTVSSLTYAAGAAQATGHRWQRILLSEGLIERQPQGIDGRKHIVSLTQTGRSLMDKFLTRLLNSETSIPTYRRKLGTQCEDDEADSNGGDEPSLVSAR